MQLVQATAELGDKIQQLAVAVIVHWLLLIVVCDGIWISERYYEFIIGRKEKFSKCQSIDFGFGIAIVLIFSQEIKS